MARAVFPGSFDPVTLGHLDIISRVSFLFEEIVVLVAQAQNKISMFNQTERVDMLKECVQRFPNVKVACTSGLTVDFARSQNIKVLIRGLRTVSDFESEWVIAHMNKRLDPSIESFFVLSGLEESLISSRVVKEVAVGGGNLNHLIPANVIPKVLAKLKENT